MSETKLKTSRLASLLASTPASSAVQGVYLHWKLIFCATLINFFLVVPVYLYGLITSTIELDLWHISPPIFFNGFYLVVSPWIYGKKLKNLQRTNSRIVNGIFIILVVIIIFTGISISSLYLSPSSSMTITTLETVMSTMLIAIFYGLFGGVGSCILMAMTWNLINEKFNTDNPVQLNFSFSMGHALSQLLLPLIFSALSPLLSSSNLIVLLGALPLITVPIFLALLTKDSEQLQIEDNFQYYSAANLEEESRYVKPPVLQRFNVRIPDELEVRVHQLNNEANGNQSWKNPNTFHHRESPETCDYKLITPDGVEVMDVIYEESEPGSLFTSTASSIGTLPIEEEVDLKSLEQAYDEINRKYSSLRQSRVPVKTFRKTMQWTSRTCTRIKGTAYREILNPIKRTMKIFKFYPSVCVKSFDAYTYVLFINCLPRLAFSGATSVIGTLFMSISLPWLLICCATLWLTEKSLLDWQDRLTIFAMTIKFFGYYLLYATTASRISLYVSCTLIGAGQGISFLMLDFVIRSLFSTKRWMYTRGSIYSCSGLLILFYGVLSELFFPLMAFKDILLYFILTPHCLGSGFFIFYQIFYRIRLFYEDHLGIS